MESDCSHRKPLETIRDVVGVLTLLANNVTQACTRRTRRNAKLANHRKDESKTKGCASHDDSINEAGMQSSSKHMHIDMLAAVSGATI